MKSARKKSRNYSKFMNDELMLLDRARGLITLQAKKGIPLGIGMNLLVH